MVVHWYTWYEKLFECILFLLSCTNIYFCHWFRTTGWCKSNIHQINTILLSLLVELFLLCLTFECKASLYKSGMVHWYGINSYLNAAFFSSFHTNIHFCHWFRSWSCASDTANPCNFASLELFLLCLTFQCIANFVQKSGTVLIHLLLVLHK